MSPHNELVKKGHAFCLAEPGHAYAFYLPTGGSVTISLAPNSTYDVAWWNPANGKDANFEGQQTIQGGTQHLTAPGDHDWALRIVHHAAH